MCTCVTVWMHALCVCVSAHTCVSPQRPEESSGFLQVRVTSSCSCLTWMLEFEQQTGEQQLLMTTESPMETLKAQKFWNNALQDAKEYRCQL